VQLVLILQQWVLLMIFIATGTQLKIEKPTKGCAVTACDNV